MRRLTSPLTCALIAVLIAIPARAGAAAAPELRGTTVLLYSGSKDARLNFGVSVRTPGLRVRFSDQGSFATKALGRRGSAFRYQASVRSRRPLRIGVRYTVRFVAPDGSTVTRRIVLTQRL